MMNVIKATAIASVVCALIAAAPGDAPSLEQVVRASYAVHDLGDALLSPDGSAVLYRESFAVASNASASLRISRLYVQRRDGTAPIRITAGAPGKDYDEEEAAYSPDGTKIAFLSDARSQRVEHLYVADALGRTPRSVFAFTGNVQELHFSPDGTRVAVLYIPSAHRQTGALAPGARDVGVIGSTVDEQRLATIDLATKQLRYVTPADTYVYEYNWSPDSKRFAFTFAKGNGDNNWWIAKLATVNADGSSMRTLLAPPYQINAPRWSPDGKTVAIIGGIMSDFGSVGGDVYMVDATTGQARDVTANASLSASALLWVAPGTLDFRAHVRGAIHIMQLDVTSGRIVPLTQNAETITSMSATSSGKLLAIVRSSWDAAPEVWTGPPSALVQLTHVNAHTQRYWGKAESLTWTSDQYTAQGWLIYPYVYDPSKRYPMVTIVHGGPSAESLPSYASWYIASLSSQGYFVFEPNPRGSFGAGEAFTAANVKDFGYGDWRDDLAGVDKALASAPIDPQRLGLFGWSYGGYMAMWAETQTTRFKAIVAGAGIVNWQSYYGQNKIDQWMVPFFGASVYDDPAVYARSSPITFIKQSKTPVLIMQGERDEEVPAPQAFEFWHAMTTLGVPTKLVVYADEGHSPQRLNDQVDILRQTVGWLDTYLK
jgi:dipeptidyl aminopeptidase/acylaminoacyl peptidase